MIGIGIFVFLYLGRNLITHKAMFLCFFPLVFLREVVVVLKHEKPLSVLWMQRNCSLSIFLDEQFNLFIRVTFTYPLILAKLYLQENLFCLQRSSYFLSLLYCKFYCNFSLRVKKKMWQFSYIQSEFAAQTLLNSKFALYMVIFSHLIVVYENILNGFIRMIYIINKSDSHE